MLSGSGAFDFGSSRDPQSRVLLYSIEPRVPNGQRIKVQEVDLVSGGNVIPARHMTIGKRFVSKGKMFKLVVRIDPGGAKPGEYTGQVPISAGGRVLDKAELTAKVRAQVWGSEKATIFWAFIAILLGAAGGAVLKWLADAGAKLQALNNRFLRVVTVLGASRLPVSLRQQLVGIQTALDSLAAGPAETQLTPIETHLDSILRLSLQFDRLTSAVEEQRQEIQRLEDPDKHRLLAIVQSENQELAEALDDSWPDPTSGQAKFREAYRGIQLFSHFLGAFKTENAARRNALRKAIDLIRKREYDKAEEVMKEAPGKAVAPAPTELGEALEQLMVQEAPTALSRLTSAFFGLLTVPAAGAAGAPPPPPPPPPAPGWLRRIRRRFIRYAGLVTGSIIAVIVALVGLTLLFFPDETFGGAADWLTLILWGFGVQLSGFSLAQLGGRTLGSGPKITEAPRA